MGSGGSHAMDFDCAGLRYPTLPKRRYGALRLKLRDLIRECELGVREAWVVVQPQDWI